MKDSLKINRNDDGSFTAEWDKKDPDWSWLNNLTSKELQNVFEQAIRMDQKRITGKVEFQMNCLRSISKNMVTNTHHE